MSSKAYLTKGRTGREGRIAQIWGAAIAILAGIWLIQAFASSASGALLTVPTLIALAGGSSFWVGTAVAKSARR